MLSSTKPFCPKQSPGLTGALNIHIYRWELIVISHNTQYLQQANKNIEDRHV